MKLSIGSVLNMTPVTAAWEIAFDIGGETGTVVCPVIGWATVVSSLMKDGTAHTEIKPAFVWGDMVWTEADLREHTPDLRGITLRHPTLPGIAGPSALLGHSAAGETAKYADLS
ncbi:hypothetical protein PV729_26690 [Streptomyces europaeiscabiei]|uniref:Uncharacterized protein n=1 Tax=Streptomyces europaeiscabiei TaxID=146819 RepID=A0ABU4NQH9_9ACTN|nr:hypothetical protein [Streptomyces europaeiscabiei]MDX2771445.1 hypothetical protein [Streptomyces europaeiscabiei]MDX3555311.1 hypothetical protein [Streptomyces europaeiscabiei]MDX3705325.1 hypothetical protein [Streptomyces europaeiscabiei]